MVTLQRTAQADTAHALRGWLFFQRRAEPLLWCAVVHGHAIPEFLLSEAWQLHGRDTAAPLVGRFREPQARQGVALSGFYLFHAVTHGEGFPGQATAPLSRPGQGTQGRPFSLPAVSAWAA